MKNKGLFLIAAFAAIGTVAIISACETIPKGVKVVKPFNKDKYLGKWYEIARFDFQFEKGLSHVTAVYSLNKDGSIKVVNRGYNAAKNKQEEAIGKAKFVDDPAEAKLKVSFFGPFYSGYNVLAIDQDYKYALVGGKNFDYLWLLSRDTTMPENVKHDYLQKAKEIGYDVSRLIWVKHN